MSALIVGGSGLLGRGLTRLLNATVPDLEIRWLSRPNPNRDVPSYVKNFEMDVSSGKVDDAAFSSLDHLVFLAGYPLAQGRLDDTHKALCWSSRVDAVRLLASRAPRLKTLVGASAIGYYGASDFTDAKHEDDAPGNDWAAELVKAWEAEYKAFEVERSVVLRIPPVLSGDGGAYPNLALPVKFGVGAALGSGNQTFPFIHERDMSRLLEFALFNPDVRGVFNAVTSPQYQLTNTASTQVIASVLGRPLFMPNLPEFVVNAMLGSEVARLVLHGGPIANDKLLATGFDFKFPSLEDAVREIEK